MTHKTTEALRLITIRERSIAYDFARRTSGSVAPHDAAAFRPGAGLSNLITTSLQGTSLRSALRQNGFCQVSGSKKTFDEIAAEEKLTERYVRRLAQLAFLSPKIVEAIENGTAPTHATLSYLTQSLPSSWKEQEERIGSDQQA